GPSVRLQTSNSNAGPVPLDGGAVLLDAGGTSTSGPVNGGSVLSNSPVWPTRYTQFAPRLGAAYRISDKECCARGAVSFTIPASASRPIRSMDSLSTDGSSAREPALWFPCPRRSIA